MAIGAAKGLAMAVSVLWLAACAAPNGSVQPADEQWREVAGSTPAIADRTVKTAEADTATPGAVGTTPAVQEKPPLAASTQGKATAPVNDVQTAIQPIREMASPADELKDPPPPGVVQAESGLAATADDKGTSRVKAQLTEVASADTDVAKSDPTADAGADADAGQTQAAEVMPKVQPEAHETAVVEVPAVPEANKEAANKEAASNESIEVAEVEPPIIAESAQADVANKAADSIALRVCTEEIDGLAVGDDGCAILNGALTGIEFGPDNAKLTDNARVLLDSVATVMEKKQGLRLAVATYSQDLDDSALGQLQSRRRTLAVIRYLISNGIESARVRPNSLPLPDEFTPGDASTNLLVLQTVAE